MCSKVKKKRLKRSVKGGVPVTVYGKKIYTGRNEVS